MMSEYSKPTKSRIESIDILRGIVMVIMALDHVRDFFHVHAVDQNPLNPATTTAALFFTRWITHFCAPTFVFLSGTSAFLVGRKKGEKALSLFLIRRGVWLIIIDAVVMTFALTLNPSFNLVVLSILWAIGMSMIILGILVRTGIRWIWAVALLIFLFHNVFDQVNFPKTGVTGFFMGMFLTGAQSFYPLTPHHTIAQFYVVLPWTSVMLLGYVAGKLYSPEVAQGQRKKALLFTGITLIILFVVLRWVNIYGDPSRWQTQENNFRTVLSFLNTTKYPCSLDFLSMTLGPALIVLALLENVKNRLTNILTVYGRVPFFYYVLHFYVIRALTIVLFYATGFTNRDIIDPQVPFYFRPLHFGFDLPVIYLIWFCLVVAMYYPCKWFDRFKRSHHYWWLSYT